MKKTDQNIYAGKFNPNYRDIIELFVAYVIAITYTGTFNLDYIEFLHSTKNMKDSKA